VPGSLDLGGRELGLGLLGFGISELIQLGLDRAGDCPLCGVGVRPALHRSSFERVEAPAAITGGLGEVGLIAADEAANNPSHRSPVGRVEQPGVFGAFHREASFRVCSGSDLVGLGLIDFLAKDDGGGVLVAVGGVTHQV